MGRIHRYGQEKDCLILNFVATNTREGRVLQKLFERLADDRRRPGPAAHRQDLQRLGRHLPCEPTGADGPRHVRPATSPKTPSRTASSRMSMSERFRQITDSTLEGLGQAGTEPLGHRSASRPRPANAAWCPRSSKTSSSRRGRWPGSIPRRRNPNPTSTGLVASLAPCSRSATGWNPASANWAASTGRSSSTSAVGEGCHVGMDHAGPSAVRVRP